MPPGEALLLVEDDPALVDLLERLLTGQGYAVTPARDVQSGLHAALTRPFAAMVLDRRLPDGDGVELLARLRRQGVATPALILTAHGTVQDRVEGLDSGADDYLVKPFVAEELLARLRALLRRQLDSAVVLPLGEGALDLEAREALRPTGRGWPCLPGRRACSRCSRAGRRGSSPGRSCATPSPPRAPAARSWTPMSTRSGASSAGVGAHRAGTGLPRR